MFDHGKNSINLARIDSIRIKLVGNYLFHTYIIAQGLFCVKFELAMAYLVSLEIGVISIASTPYFSWSLAE